MHLIIILLSLFISSCNVIELMGKETYLDEATFRNLRIGDICRAASNSASSPFHNGDGSSGNPYVICNADQLQEMDNYLNSSFRLDADISLARIGDFYPVGYCYETTSCNSGSDMPFVGNFNGHFYNIYNLKISKSHQTGVGMFGLVGSQAYIKDFNVYDASINIASSPGSYYMGIGGIAGFTQISGSPTFENIEFRGNLNLNGGANGVGGIVGHMRTGEIRNSTSNATISVSGNASQLIRNIGGVAGNTSGNIVRSRSYSTINIESTSTNTIMNIGGLAGSSPAFMTWRWIEDSFSKSSIYISSPSGSANAVGGLIGKSGFTISGTYADTSINLNNNNADYQIGGLIGSLSGGTLRNSFGIGNFSSTTSSTYGLAGSVNSSTVSDTYTNTASCYNGGGGCTPSTSPATFKGNSSALVFTSGTFPWDFTNIWQVRSNDYPSFSY